jgi:cysteine desulfurase/selenocysteine lyase
MMIQSVQGEHSTPDALRLARMQFPALRDRIYMDSACIGLAPLSVANEVTRYVQRTLMCPAESGTAQHQAMGKLRDDARPVLAELLNCASDDIALMESATHGLGVAAQALPLRRGDRVLMSNLEFIQMGAVWSQMSKQGVELDVVPNRNGQVSVDDFREHMSVRTRVLAVSSVQWTNGFRVDLAGISQLCQDRRLILMVDAAQHLGVLPMNVSSVPVDILVSSGHKWLNAPFGMGMMYVSPRIRADLRLPIAGFFAAEPPDNTWGESFQRPETSPVADYRFVKTARAWEIGGTANFAGAVGLAAATRLALTIGLDNIAAHSRALTDQMIEGLDRARISIVSPREDGVRSGIVTVSLGEAAANLSALRYLLDAGIAVGVRYASGVGGIRVSCHYFNVADEVDAVLDALRSARAALESRNRQTVS